MEWPRRCLRGLPDPHGLQATPDGETQGSETPGSETPELLAVSLPGGRSHARRTLLGYTRSLLGDAGLLLDTGAATFLFEGVSRTYASTGAPPACLIQPGIAALCGSEQGGLECHHPPAVQASPEAMAEMADFWRLAEEKYARLRQLGIRKEDARLLPNAAETHYRHDELCRLSHLAEGGGQSGAVGDQTDGAAGPDAARGDRPSALCRALAGLPAAVGGYPPGGLPVSESTRRFAACRAEGYDAGVCILARRCVVPCSLEQRARL